MDPGLSPDLLEAGEQSALSKFIWTLTPGNN